MVEATSKYIFLSTETAEEVLRVCGKEETEGNLEGARKVLEERLWSDIRLEPQVKSQSLIGPQCPVCSRLMSDTTMLWTHLTTHHESFLWLIQAPTPNPRIWHIHCCRRDDDASFALLTHGGEEVWKRGVEFGPSVYFPWRDTKAGAEEVWRPRASGGPETRSGGVPAGVVGGVAYPGHVEASRAMAMIRVGSFVRHRQRRGSLVNRQLLFPPTEGMMNPDRSVTQMLSRPTAPWVANLSRDTLVRKRAKLAVRQMVLWRARGEVDGRLRMEDGEWTEDGRNLFCGNVEQPDARHSETDPPQKTTTSPKSSSSKHHWATATDDARRSRRQSPRALALRQWTPPSSLPARSLSCVLGPDSVRSLSRKFERLFPPSLSPDSKLREVVLDTAVALRMASAWSAAGARDPLLAPSNWNAWRTKGAIENDDPIDPVPALPWEREEVTRALQQPPARVQLDHQYLHSTSGAPYRLEEEDSDSDSGAEAEGGRWRVRGEVQALAAAEDLSPSQARFFALWNVFASKYRIYADYVAPRALLAFARAHGRHILASGLRQHLLCHAMLLWEEQLVDTQTILTALEIVDSYAAQDALVALGTRTIEHALRNPRESVPPPAKRRATAAAKTSSAKC